MKSLFTVSLLTAALLSSSALAQNPQPADRNAPAATSQTTAPAANAALKNNWRASKLMGLDVYNQNNEKLGDVNEILLDKSGKVTAVVIGVGGFLGMGEHDVAVSMDKLKFVDEPTRTSSTAPATKETTTTAPSNTTTGTATTNTTTTTRTRTTHDWVPDHAVMNATKDQLKALPQFKYSDYN